MTRGYRDVGFLEVPTADTGSEWEPFRPTVIEGPAYPPPGNPRFAVPSEYPGGGGGVDTAYRPIDGHGDPLPEAFVPDGMGPWSFAGLIDRLAFGTRTSPTPIPGSSGYEPITDDTSPSVTSGTVIRPRISVALNLRLHLAPRARFAQPVPAREAARLADVNQRGRGGRDRRGRHHRGSFGGMMPQPIFPGRVTDWPRSEPRYLSFGGRFQP